MKSKRLIITFYLAYTYNVNYNAVNAINVFINILIYAIVMHILIQCNE